MQEGVRQCSKPKRERVQATRSQGWARGVAGLGGRGCRGHKDRCLFTSLRVV